MKKENVDLKRNLKSFQKEMDSYKDANQNFSSIQSYNSDMQIPFSVNVCKSFNSSQQNHPKKLAT